MNFFFLWRCGPTRAMTSSFLRFLDHTQRRTTVGRTPLDEWSARRRDLYLTTHNTKQYTAIHAPRRDSKPTTSAGERPQTYALDRAATGTGLWTYTVSRNVLSREERTCRDMRSARDISFCACATSVCRVFICPPPQSGRWNSLSTVIPTLGEAEQFRFAASTLAH